MADPIRTEISVEQERAVLVGLLLPGMDYDPRDPLGELESLAATAGAIEVGQLLQQRQKPVAATFIGSGKLDELAMMVKELRADVVIFDNDLSPAQLRNVEQVAEVKVLDRSELILDIFAGRAQTYEARLQVELAQLEYTYPRLRAMWSHLERIAGGSPAGIGTRGPGEQQLEIDRRLVQRRKAELRREIEQVQMRKQREVAQRNVDFFTVGLVGYTNAGKSTLFNTLTGAQVYADDRLFATLDTRTRKWELGGGHAVLLSDTVGFVRNLPHHLVASFRATLEESINSDLLLIVVDLADPEAEKHLQTVDHVLDEIGAGEVPRLLLLNKIDQLEDNAQVLIWQQRYPESLAISAVRGLGLDKLVEKVNGIQSGRQRRVTIRLPMHAGKAMSFLENRAVVHDRVYTHDSALLTVSIGRRQMDQFRALGESFELVEPESNS